MSDFAWTLPGAGTAGLPPAAAQTEADRLFGKDLFYDASDETGADLKMNQAGDWLIVSGPEALRQALIRRIVTNPGEWQTLPEYGVGARLYVKERNTQAARDELSQRLRAQMLADRRVESVASVSVDFTDQGQIDIAVTVVPRGRTLSGEAVSLEVEVS
jgi:hypothetical protein